MEITRKQTLIEAESIITKKQYSMICITSVIISLIFTVSKSFNSNALALFGTLILLIVFVFVNVDESLLLMTILIPNIRVIKLVGADMAILSYCFLLAEMKFLISRTNKMKIEVPIFLLSCSVLITVLLNQDYNYLVTYFRFFVFLLFINEYLNKHSDSKERINFPKYFVFGSVINILCGFIYYGISGIPLFKYRFRGVSIDPNYFATVIAVSMAFVFVFFYNTKHRSFCIILEIGLLICGFLSASRMFVLSLVWILVGAFGSIFSKNNFKKVFSIFLVFVILLVCLWPLISPIFSNVLQRFDSSSTEGANGREDAWVFYLANWRRTISSFLFGSSSNLDLYFDRVPIVQHNMYIESLSQIGIIGTVLLLLEFIVLFKKTVKQKIFSIIGAVPLLVALTSYFSLNGLFSETTSFIFILSFMSYEYISNIKSSQ